MRTFEVVYQTQPWRNRSFKVIGVCKFDVLNPCFDGKWASQPNKHWGGDDMDACPACIAEAARRATPTT